MRALLAIIILLALVAAIWERFSGLIVGLVALVVLLGGLVSIADTNEKRRFAALSPDARDRELAQQAEVEARAQAKQDKKRAEEEKKWAKARARYERAEKHKARDWLRNTSGNAKCPACGGKDWAYGDTVGRRSRRDGPSVAVRCNRCGLDASLIPGFGGWKVRR